MARTVHVTAIPMDGYDRFFRGGHMWPATGKTVNVTDELLKVLKAEKRLNVDTDVDKDDSLPLVDIRDNRAFYDHAWNASRETRIALAEEERQLHIMEAELKLEEVRAKKAEVAAKLVAKKAPAKSK